MSDSESEQGVKQVPSWVEHEPGDAPAQSLDQVSQRVQRLIKAAELTAEAIRSDAERQAVEYLTEAQRRADRLTSERISLIASLTDDLIGHAGAVHSHSGQMVDSLERTIKTITEGERMELGSADGSSAALSAGESPEAGAAAAGTPGVTAYGGSGEGVEATDAAGEQQAGAISETDDDVVLYATRLAIAGSERAEIASALREERGVSDPEPILDRVLGSH